ncbi:uracil-DNA glycosylase [Actibacterium sp. 188UL27-1]|uniref:uracil-DNA glycosylase n=1 Tax=Actibacterium sp. 188UL27-1 TaxID=2786961 RepID=UPI00195CC49F|nr:uracil-DNA glycosylase [Actibacterium sp. 188UL27-1]MBM7067648.1 uracil-DNA glycosylase [Actibacterium sp. 188UL27-1]
MALDVSRLGAWRDLSFFSHGLPLVEAALDNEDRAIFPPSDQIFAAFELCPPEAVRVLVLGQDPYPTRGHAHGLAFSAEPHVTPLPRSLANIYAEMTDDLGGRPANGDLRFWARQGVLLLNTALTVPEGDAGGHMKIGWQDLTHQVLDHLDQAPLAALLWGKPAQKLGAALRHPDHLKIETAHPSPLSARRGFFGSHPFSAVNRWLESRGSSPINWIKE